MCNSKEEKKAEIGMFVTFQCKTTDSTFGLRFGFSFSFQLDRQFNFNSALNWLQFIIQGLVMSCNH